jgi:hypothetical protein
MRQPWGFLMSRDNKKKTTECWDPLLSRRARNGLAAIGLAAFCSHFFGYQYRILNI